MKLQTTKFKYFTFKTNPNVSNGPEKNSKVWNFYGVHIGGCSSIT